MTGLYIHVPFCLRKCPYCDFYSTGWSMEASDSFTDAVVRNIKRWQGKGVSVDTVYFGGGTPSLLTPEQTGSILDAVAASFSLEKPEVTMECNPSSSDYDKFCGYRAAGVNRLSFGVQSADDSQLRTLGRLHSFRQAGAAVSDAVKAGFFNISCDIMLGLCGQTPESLEDSIDRICSLPVTHISAYMLKIEENTPYNCDEIKKSVADDELMRIMYLTAVDMLEDKGFMQYEISNFAKPGMESRHNLKYWLGGEYIGIGPSAHSYFQGKRYMCPDDVKSFAANNLQAELVTDEKPDRLEEYIMLGLRLKEGISLSRLSELGGREFAKKAAANALALEKGGLCRCDGGRIALTPEGFLVSNAVILHFIES
ncbi:radical SAM family heme chaperone HemW [Ruminococcus sp. Marseille-P6503]|uniref:radical SAM family heme chaperone HemW n=1 Tax=Ruminococcus sp. Marseille-P6503 TaxID=2364796 RepID=UPI000F5336BE|nr:radical SAM family heme chaperone HemW [Ruminococcus sp. Marseille-P6503]